ncbi:MAG: TonB-dependent receptor, partial [Lentisphaeria bacterium]|nr:TonB-dependent receptor [Lentisphaeria bacterium]NQZ67596.1 TonB-dependent receptor [Lentisphaeria bacterium]
GSLDLSLDDLFNLEVTSVSKKAEPLFKAASAIHVVTAEDIKRIGARSIPEALRYVPGLIVSRISANRWEISVRGFGGAYTNKLLVLMDGRTLYTPTFGGVFWNQHHTNMDDIERIEVIRGPGSTLWGANAVNGVINIITKSSKYTQGGQVHVGGGDYMADASFRYGFEPKENMFLRFYSQDRYIENYKNLANGEEHGRWNMLVSGFRMDWQMTDDDLLTFQGDWFRNNYDTTVNKNTDKPIDGGNLIFRYSKKLNNDSDFKVQAYYDYYRHKEQTIQVFEAIRDTYDIEIQYSFKLGSHEINSGIGYRESEFDFIADPFATFVFFEDERIEIANFFVMDKISIIEDKLSLTLGSKFEYNNYTHLEIQPNVRLVWTPDDKNTVWFSASRAARTPAAAETTLFMDILGPPPAIQILGSETIDAEDMKSLELGWRTKLTESFMIDLATFYNEYDDLLGQNTTFVAGLPVIVEIENNGEAVVYGAELSAVWFVSDEFNIRTGYSYAHMAAKALMEADPSKSIFNVTEASNEEDLPRNTLYMMTHYELTDSINIDVNVSYIDSVGYSAQFGSRNTNSLIRTNVRLSYSPNKDFEFYIMGTNLQDKWTNETGSGFGYDSMEIPRTVFAGLRMKF